MNFGVIFLCLLIGCVIGYETGKYVTGKKIGEALAELGESMKKSAEETKKKREEAEKRLAEVTVDILKGLAERKQASMAEEKEHADLEAENEKEDE